MTIRTYRDFVLEAGDLQRDVVGNQAFTVAVTHSPLGQIQPESRSVAADLVRRLGQRERRLLDVDEILAISALAQLQEGLAQNPGNATLAQRDPDLRALRDDLRPSEIV